MATVAPPELVRKKFTVEEFLQMAEVGLIQPREGGELLDGEIVEMSPVGPLHSSIVNRLTKLLVPMCGNDAIVSVQNSFRLNPISLPELDFALYHPRDDFYSSRHAEPKDIFLVIEVADSSLLTDRMHKLPLYAKENVAEAWIVNCHNQTVEQYTQPAGGDYQQKNTIQLGGRIQATQIANIDLTTE